MNAQRFQLTAREGRKKAFQICSGIAVVVLLGNTGALIDAILHPEIPYFDKEHLIVGGVTAFVVIVLLGIIARYVRHLEEALTEVEILKDQAEQSCDEIETLVAKRTKELCESRERLAHILSSNPAVIYTAKPDSDYGPKFISDNVTAQLGYAPTEFLEDPAFWTSHIHPEDLQRVLEELSDLHEQGHSTHEYRFRHKDGSYLWIRDEMNLIKDENGTPIEVMGHRINVTDRKQADEALRIAHDDLEIGVQKRTAELRTMNEKLLREIAERKRVEEALKLEREQLLSIFDSINEVISVIDSETYEILYVNKFVKNQYGEDMIGGLCYKELHGLDSPCGHCTKEMAISLGGEPYRWDYHNPTSNKDYLATDRIIRWTDGRDAKFHLGIDVTERKKAEKDLRESRERLQVVLDAIPAAVFWKDRDSVYVGANRAWLEAAGLNSSEEVVGKTDYDLPWEKDQANSYREHDRKVMESGIPQYDIIEPYVRADGALAWAKTNKVPLRDLEGNVVGVLGTFEDITDRKHGEQALRESEQRLSQIINFLPDATLAIDREGRVIAWNRAIADMTGVPAVEMIGKGNYEYALPFYGTRRPILIDLVLTPNEEIRQAYSFFKADHNILTVETDDATPLGKKVTLWAMAAPLYDAYRNIIGAIESIRDISERKLAQEERAKSEQLLQAVLDASPAAIALLRNRQLVWGNKTFEDILGVSVEELGGCNVRRFYASDEEYRRIGDTIYPGLAKGAVREAEVLLKHGDGSTFPALLRVTMVGETTGDQTVVALFMDITERKRAEEVLRESEKRYRDLVEKANDIIYVLFQTGQGEKGVGC